jgi:hypothetical protein
MRIALAIVIVLVSITASKRVGAEGRIGIDGHGGWNTYSMQALNGAASSFNQDFGTALPPIQDGGSWGLGLRLWPHSDVRIRLGYERLNARSEGSGVAFDLGAQAYTFGLAWFPPTTSPIRFGVGAALGPHSANGGLDVPGARLKSSGGGFGGQVAGEAMVPLGKGWSVNGVLGYRWMTIDTVKLNDSSGGLKAQYDGMLLQIGLALDSRR